MDNDLYLSPSDVIHIKDKRYRLVEIEQPEPSLVEEVAEALLAVKWLAYFNESTELFEPDNETRQNLAKAAIAALRKNAAERLFPLLCGAPTKEIIDAVLGEEE